MQPTLTPQPQAGTPIQPQAATVSPQGVASQVPVGAPTPPSLSQGQTPVATPGQVATPNFDTSGALGDIANYYNIPRQTAAIAGAGQAQGAVAQANFEAQKAQNQIKIENEKNQLDPTKYQFSKNSDGSVTILNSVGDKVDIGTYSALTGADPATALQKAGATDQASQKFIAAYNNFQTYAQDMVAAQHGDQQAKIAVGEFQAANKGLANLELGQLGTAFMQQYGQYFGQPSAPSSTGTQLGNLKNVGSTLTSRNSPIASSPYQELQQYPQLNQPNPITQQLLGNGSYSSQINSILGQQTNPQTGL